MTGVWVGGEDRATHFKNILYGQGASMALPIWALYMKDNYADPELEVSQEDFEQPEEMSIRIDCDKPVEEEEKNQELEDDLEGLEF